MPLDDLIKTTLDAIDTAALHDTLGKTRNEFPLQHTRNHVYDQIPPRLAWRVCLPSPETVTEWRCVLCSVRTLATLIKSLDFPGRSFRHADLAGG